MMTEPSLLLSRDSDLNVDACIVINLMCVDELGWKNFNDDETSESCSCVRSK